MTNTNIVSEKCAHSFKRNVASELGHISISQVRNIVKALKELLEKGDIIRFEKAPNGLNGSPKFHIFYNEKRFFDVIFSSPKRMKLSKGVEVAKSSGWELKIFLGKKCRMQKIKNIIQNDISERKGGLAVERIFHQNMLALIACDKEVSQVIKSVGNSEYYDDAIRKIDKFLNLANGKKVPIQLKSSVCGQENHKKKNSNVPSLVYSGKMPEDLLKEKILRICKSYPNIKEHL